MYGSIFCSVTRRPRASRSDPIEAAARPLPNDDTTPPVTKMYFGATSASLRQQSPDLFDLRRTVRDATVQPPVPQLGEDTRDCRPARAELDRLGAEAALPRPRERPGQLGDEAPGRRGEPVAGIQETEGAAPPEPRQRLRGVRLDEDPLEFGDDPLSRERRVRREAERERLRPGGRRIRGEAEARRVARGPEQARRILHVRQRVEHA